MKRYWVELIVDDGLDIVFFVMFNKDLIKILNKLLVELIDYIVSYLMFEKLIYNFNNFKLMN